MIPLKDNIPYRRFPVVTVTLIVANVVLFLVDWITQQQVVVAQRALPDGRVVQYVDQVGALTHAFSLIPANLTSDFAHAWPTIFISMFLHANWLHVGGNMLYLWVFGGNTEDTLGKGRFLVFYLACGVIAALSQVATGMQSTTPVIGASGAIAGVMGAYFILFPNAEILSIVPIFFFGMFMNVPAIIVIGFWAVLNFINVHWMGAGSVAGGGVAYTAHVGGFLAGMLFILLLGGRRLVQSRSRDYDYYLR